MLPSGDVLAFGHLAIDYSVPVEKYGAQGWGFLGVIGWNAHAAMIAIRGMLAVSNLRSVQSL
jgi:hypothetical protein